MKDQVEDRVGTERPDDDESPREEFDRPKLTYVKPKLEKHSIKDVTAGFIGTFYP